MYCSCRSSERQPGLFDPDPECETVTGGFQIGFASLVDLKTGEIVWFNRLIRGAGDLREAEKAEGTMKLLLKDFPV